MTLNARPLRVLVVDEDGDVFRFLAGALPAAAVTREVGAAPALARLATAADEPFDLVIVDCDTDQRPPRGGPELARVVATRWPWLSVVICTPPGEQHRLAHTMFPHTLRKPLDAIAIRRTIRGVQGAIRSRRTRSVSSSAMKRVLAFVGEHYTESIAHGDLARMAAMSRSHFSRVFRGVAGVSLRDYVRELRLARARELISSSPLSLTAIAHEIGYYDLPHFDKAFRKRFGRAPSAYVEDRAAGAAAANGRRRPA
jgi:AraC-like DNA-binding protein